MHKKKVYAIKYETKLVFLFLMCNKKVKILKKLYFYIYKGKSGHQQFSLRYSFNCFEKIKTIFLFQFLLFVLFIILPQTFLLRK